MGQEGLAGGHSDYGPALSPGNNLPGQRSYSRYGPDDPEVSPVIATVLLATELIL